MNKREILDFYFNPRGKVARRQFWSYYVLPVFIYHVVVALIARHDAFNFMDDVWPMVEIVAIVLAIPVQLTLLWVSLAVCSKRMRGIGYPGRTLLAMIPGIGSLWVLWELLFSSTKKSQV